jgi:FKBP-type peptidyl-prolyl cis-trans isomerase (trigger factor)
MKTTIEKQPKATIQLTVTVEAEKVKEAYEKVLDEAVQKTQIDGFRAGNAPREMVKEKVGVSNLYGDVVNKLLQMYYPQALKENAIMPIANPKVEIKTFDIEKDFEFIATVAVKPTTKVGEFKTEVKKNLEERNETIKKENMEKLKKGEQIDADHVHLGSNELIDAILKVTETEVAEILIDEETNRMMSRLVNQAQTIGLSLEQYLRSQNKTADQLRQEYAQIAERNLKAEFALNQLVQDEKIEVDEDEIQAAINASGDPQVIEQMKDPMERLYVKNVLQKNKLITKLIDEIQGEHKHEEHQQESK